MLTACQLSYQYGFGGSGIKDINLEINPGELVAVLGMNGSGKTTLGRVLGGLLLADSGQLLIAGQSVNADTLANRVGYLFSPVTRQFIGQTVEEDILFGLENRGLGHREEIAVRLQQTIIDFNLTSLRYRTIEQLSQGEQQRAALAAIMALSPEFLVLDEPTAALDADTSRWLYQYLSKLRDNGMGIVILTNQADEACRANRVYLLDNGVITAAGSPWEIATSEAASCYGLSQSFTIKLAQELKRQGADLSDVQLHVEGLVEAVWRWKSEI